MWQQYCPVSSLCRAVPSNIVGYKRLLYNAHFIQFEYVRCISRQRANEEIRRKNQDGKVLDTIEFVIEMDERNTHTHSHGHKMSAERTTTTTKNHKRKNTSTTIEMKGTIDKTICVNETFLACQELRNETDNIALSIQGGKKPHIFRPKHNLCFQ